MADPSSGNSGSFPSLQIITTAVQNVVTAIGALNQTISNIFPSQTGTSTSAIAGTATLPSNPIGFVTVIVDGNPVKIPYYG